MKNRIQLTSDGFRPYRDAVETAFGPDVDFGMLVKQYGPDRGDMAGPYLGAFKDKVSGNPNTKKLTTAHVERQNLTMRMNIRRFGRRTNAFSKKMENHCHAIALHFMHYNFVRIHKTLKVTPAIAAGVTNHLWSLEDIVSL